MRAPPAGVTADVVVLAIKPQIMGDTLPALRSLIGPETTVLSIAAGTTLANLEAGLGPGRDRPLDPQHAGAGRPRHHRRGRQCARRRRRRGTW